MPTPTIKPTHRTITTYYETFRELAAQNVPHEMGLRRAFQQLLAETALRPTMTLRLVPDLVSGTRISWSIGVFRERKCVRCRPALLGAELADRLSGLQVCDGFRPDDSTEFSRCL
jgi:hypothetical protein